MTDSGNGNNGLSGKAFDKIGGDHGRLEFGCTKPHGRGTPGKNKLDAGKVGISFNVIFPSRLPTLHHVARLSAQNDKIKTKAFREAFAYREAVFPLDRSKIAVDKNSWTLMRNGVEIFGNADG